MNKFLVAVLSAFALTAQAQVADKKALTLDGAKNVIAAAVAEAKVERAGRRDRSSG